MVFLVILGGREATKSPYPRKSIVYVDMKTAQDEPLGPQDTRTIIHARQKNVRTHTDIGSTLARAKRSGASQMQAKRHSHTRAAREVGIHSRLEGP